MAKLVCTIELSKERGVTIKVENAEAKIVQTITMDGTTLTLEVAGEQDTSSWTQTADAIKIACKDFTLEASNSITCSATNAASLKCATGSVEATGSLSLTATSDAELSGAQVKVSGDAQLSLESAGMAKLQGATTTIGGSLIKAG